MAWAALNEPITPSNLIAGFVLGYLVLYLAQPVVGSSTYVRKVRQVIGLVLFFHWELLLASLRVAYDVVTPRHNMQPAVIAIPLDVQSDVEITLLANMITLTPGTLSLDVSADRKTLYIHSMFVEDCDEERREIKEGFEKRLIEVFR